MTVASLDHQPSPLSRSVTTLLGVGPERAAQLSRLGIRTTEELLLHRPGRYEDRQKLRAIKTLELHEPASTHGKVVAVGTKWFRQHTKSICEIVLEEGTGRLHCRWWNLPYMEKYFKVGDEVLVFGRLVSLKPRVMDHPETEVIESGEENSIHLNRITPIYPLTEGLPQRWLRSLMWRTLGQFESKIDELYVLPASESGSPGRPSAAPALVSSNKPEITQLTRSLALRKLHFPETLQETELARRKLALDEFIELQLQIQARRKHFEQKSDALPCVGDNHLIKPFLAQLGFKLTEAQTKVLRELRKDMSGQHPMRRLLQGDVGSGKTVVAACCALMSLESGYEVALMAPTEILAEQHFLNFSKWLSGLGIAVELRTGSGIRRQEAKKAARRTTRDLGRPARPSNLVLTIGTHALIESGFNPERLGLVIIDEQHKFGVAQREQLLRKGHYPHLLVMTATPIPRTLGLTLYGDLDVSVITQPPSGRGRIRTYVRTADKAPKAWDFVRSKLSEGRQAYVVYPRVEEDAQGGVKAVTKEFGNLQRLLMPFQVGLLHGRLRSREKEETMGRFRANELQVLLSTSLIEVGVDVSNATVMLIENAELFGLAQLHQLRGRIGRGAHESYCILIAATKNKEAQQRLQVLEETSDGFRIAETDLKLRGPGELLGREQSGLPRFRFGDLATDLDLINQARELAAKLQDGHNREQNPPHQR
jgi:ATP-dependent DNA helicase RecG